MNIMDDIRLQQIDELDKAIKERTTPPQRKPLSDEEIRLQWSEFWETECHPWAIEFARAIEAAHGIKEKNCG